MAVRCAKASDIPQLLALIRRYWQFEGLAHFDALRLEVLLQELIGSSARGQVWVAERAGTLWGYLALVYVVSLEHQGLMAEIDEFFVLPEARGAGLGSELLAAAEAALKRAGCVRLQLQLAVDNDAARAFYAHRGYQPRAGYGLLDKPLVAARG
ncbi:MAG TPA: GNAT family N-acetyltransferase [Steroidobacteraceae bacterium]|nr:GNAT family N-acetyltransferase [Steroidobacteraceae bacterium]